GGVGLERRTAPPGPLPLPIIDLGTLPPRRQEEEARRLTDEEAPQPFDLAVPPLWRARLLRLGDAARRLLATLHHATAARAVAHGPSTATLGRALAALSPDRALPEPDLQSADFAVWQRRSLSAAALAPQVAYWRERLAGMPPALAPPADLPRPARPGFRGTT